MLDVLPYSVAMGRGASTVIRWVGRLMVLLAIFVVVCSLFLPEAVQPLGSVICPEGLELDNSRYVPPFAADDGKLELVCTGPERTESAASKVLLVAASLTAVGLALIYLADRSGRDRYLAPSGP